MAKKDEWKWNIEDLTDAEIYDAIRYLEHDRGTGEEEDNDRGVVICVCLYIVLFVGLTCLWLYR
jgi:hypothetical protein